MTRPRYFDWVGFAWSNYSRKWALIAAAAGAATTAALFAAEVGVGVALTYLVVDEDTPVTRRVAFAGVSILAASLVLDRLRPFNAGGAVVSRIVNRVGPQPDDVQVAVWVRRSQGAAAVRAMKAAGFDRAQRVATPKGLARSSADDVLVWGTAGPESAVRRDTDRPVQEQLEAALRGADVTFELHYAMGPPVRTV